ncbi:MAG TPA: ABC transporter substrate-binding protein [Pyrinomonadaceae bacterium]|nr:ABC transporter substrate-binding protein [Pyrinomonadaceae bacterium]
MLRACSIITLVFAALTVHLPNVHPATKIPRIGVLLLSDGRGAPMEGFRQGLNELGYVEGQNIFIERRFAKGNRERLSQLAAELVDNRVNLILTAGTAQAQAIRQASTTIPIVLAISGDPVAIGLAASLARPGGNVTGLSMISPELSGKRLELLKEAAPNSSRIGVLWDGMVPENRFDFHTMQVAAASIGLKLESLQIGAADDLEAAFSIAARNRLNALVVVGGGVLNRQKKRILAFEMRNRLPTMHEQLDFAESGGLMAYGVNIGEMFRRSAAYVDKILRGAKAGELPVEQPKKFELLINLKTAKQIGVMIPPTVLARADKVIK